MTDREFDECMSAIAMGDKDSLRIIYDEYLKLIFAVVYDTIKQREEAEDITSDFFIKLYSIAKTYRPGNGHKRWLVTIAKNMAIDRIRKLDREMLYDEIPDGEQAAKGAGENTSREDERIIQKLTLKQAMDTLKPEEREIIDLKVVGGFTFREIAEMMNKPPGTVTWLYNNAINKLRRCKL